MKPNYPIAIGAGVISAIVFASASTGPTLVRMLLLSVVTLPIALAAYSYSVATAAVAAAAGIFSIALLTTLPAGAAFGGALALPAVALAYLALRQRVDDSGKTVWLGAGNVVLASALMAATVVALGLAAAGTTVEGLRTALRNSIDSMLKTGFGGLSTGSLTEADIARLADVMLQVLPGLSAAFWMVCLLGCQWIAGRVALASGQLPRPWPDLPTFRPPVITPLLLAVAIAASFFLEGMPRLFAMGFAGALYAVFVMAGLAVIHFVTRGQSWRGPALGAVYIALIIFNTGASLVLALLGLGDSFLSLRRSRST